MTNIHYFKKPLIVGLVASTFITGNAYSAEPISVSASDNDGNIPQNTLDNNLSTRWSAKGDGQYIRYDLGEMFTISTIDIGFFKGDVRFAEFDIQTSENTSDWTTVFSGVQSTLTLDQQNIVLTESTGRYVQFVGYGNSANEWNSLTEVDIGASPLNNDTPTEPSLTASASVRNDLAERVLDDDLTSRWSTNVTGATLTLDLGGSFNVNGVSIAFHRGDERENYFEIQASEDGVNWTTVIADGVNSVTTSSLEVFSFDTLSASTIRFIGGGNEDNKWILLSEMRVSVTDEEPVINEPPIDPPEEPPVSGDTYTTTVDSLDDVMEQVSAGDEVIVTGSGEISLKNYNFSTQVLIRAPSIGGTTLTNATITDSNNITLQGFVFGPNDESTLLKIVNSTNIKVLRNLFDHRDVTESQTSIVMTQASDSIELAYNEFRDKNLGDNNGSKITGSFIKTQYDSPQMTTNLHIHHNHFNNIAPFLSGSTPAGDSDREAIAMGIADSQDFSSNNLVEYNLFENCDGENEIVTVKTSDNIFRYNTFKNSMGSLSFRLGSNNEAYGNYFFGEGAGDLVSDNNYQTGGIRVYGSGHQIYDNYMENLTGISWRRPILIDSGDTSDSTGNDSHETPTNVSVSFNTIVNSVGGGVHIGSTNYSRQPEDIVIRNNTVVSSQGILFNNHANDTSNEWTGNAAYATGSADAVSGGALSSSQVEQLSSLPAITPPTPLTASDVGRFAQ